MDTIGAALKARVDAIANGVMEQHGVPSASVAVVQGGKIVYTHAYGKAHIDPDQAATPEMRYSLGSISKQFTAAAILLLQEDGKLQLDDPLSKYLPETPAGWSKVTLRNLLAQRSGVGGFEAFADPKALLQERPASKELEKRIFATFQSLLPTRAISALMFHVAQIRNAAFKNALMRWFMHKYAVGIYSGAPPAQH